MSDDTPTMRVRIAYTVKVDEGFRRAITHYMNPTNEPASRKDVQEWFRQWGDTMNDDLRSDHGVCCWGDCSPMERA